MTTTVGEQRGSNADSATPRSGAGSLVRSVLAHGAGILLALALLPLCLAVGVSFTAWAIAASLVVANRAIHGIVAWSIRDASLTVALGSMGFSMIFRALLTALALFFVGAAVGASGDTPIGMDRPDLARPAVLIFLLCFTLDAGIEAIRRAGHRDELLAAGLPSAPVTPRETTA